MVNVPETQRYLFLNRSGDRFTTHGLSVIGRKYLKELGLEGSVQVFRHTFAANWLRNGGNILTLQGVLGHKTMSMTVRYVSLFPPEVVRQLQAIRSLEEIQKSLRRG
jgi:site-specific recombinase XerD